MIGLDVAFTKMFGAPPQVTARAPGRVNLIGDHADDRGGLVLSLAIPQETRVALATRGDRTVHAVLDADHDRTPLAFDLGSEALRGAWIDSVAGTIVALHGAGHDVGGFDVVFTSNVPTEADLAASAALEIALLRGLRIAFTLDLDDVALAKIGRAAETEFVGAPATTIDHMAASLADVATVLLLDTRTLGWQRLPLPDSSEIVVIDAGIPCEDARQDGTCTGGEPRYARRRAECERAAELLGVETLREVADPATIDGLPDPIRRRARHAVTENARAAEAAVALRRGDVVALGRLLDASHASLRDDYEASSVAVDRLVMLAQRDEDVFGARLAEGGARAAIVALARRGRGADAARRILARYGSPGRVLVPETDDVGRASNASAERRSNLRRT